MRIIGIYPKFRMFVIHITLQMLMETIINSSLLEEMEDRLKESL